MPPGAADLEDRAMPTRRRTAETPLDGTEEYPVEGGLRYGRPALSVRFGDEVRGIEWRLDGPEILTEGNASEPWSRFRVEDLLRPVPVPRRDGRPSPGPVAAAAR
jgi:hypothetical protein